MISVPPLPPAGQYELAEAVIPKLERPGVHVVSARVTDTHFYLQATSDRVTAEVRRGDIVQAGVVIANSEVGASSLRISPMVYRLICTNGLISGSELRQHHVGRGLDPNEDGATEFYRDETCRAVDRAFWLKVVDTVDAAMNEALFGQLVDKLRVAAGEPLDAKPSEIVEVVARRFGLTEAEQDGVLQQLALGADWTHYGVVNAVTRIAEDSETYDCAVELERIGGEVLELPASVSVATERKPTVSATRFKKAEVLSCSSASQAYLAHMQGTVRLIVIPNGNAERSNATSLETRH